MKKQFYINGQDFSVYCPYPIVTDDVNAYEIVLKASEDISGASFVITAVRSDGVKITDIGSVSGSTATYVMKNSMHSLPGELRVRASVLSSDGSCLTAKEIIYNVIEGHGNDGIEADDRYPVLTSLIFEARGLMEEMRGNDEFYTKKVSDNRYFPKASAEGIVPVISKAAEAAPAVLKVYGTSKGVGDLVTTDEGEKYKVGVRACGDNLIDNSKIELNKRIYGSGTGGAWALNASEGKNKLSVVAEGIKPKTTYTLYNFETEKYSFHRMHESDNNDDYWYMKDASTDSTNTCTSNHAFYVDSPHWESKRNLFAYSFETDSDTVCIAISMEKTDGAEVTEEDRNIRLMLVEGTVQDDMEYTPFSGSEVFAYLDSPLYEGEYLDVVNKKVIRGENAEALAFEDLTFAEGVNHVEVTASVQPINIKVEYYQNPTLVIEELRNAILAQGGNV